MSAAAQERYSGGCFCGAVRFAARAPIRGAQVCHCSICRQLQGASLGVVSTFFDREAFEITEGEESLIEYVSPKKYSRRFCKHCGARVYLSFERCDVRVPLAVVYPTLLDSIKGGGLLPAELSPERHIYYADRLVDVPDGKPKFKDMPKEFGGSGVRLDDRGNVLP